MTWLADERGCGKCDHCGMDMDMDPFCVQPEVIAKAEAEIGRAFPYGLKINSARRSCNGDSWKPRIERSV